MRVYGSAGAASGCTDASNASGLGVFAGVGTCSMTSTLPVKRRSVSDAGSEEEEGGRGGLPKPMLPWSSSLGPAPLFDDDSSNLTLLAVEGSTGWVQYPGLV